MQMQNGTFKNENKKDHKMQY